MFTRCTFTDCNLTFEVADELAYKPVLCEQCKRLISVRSLERHVAVEKVIAHHEQNGTLFDASRFDQEKKIPQVIGVLEDIRSLWNVGSMFRTADGGGCQSLVITGITGYPPRKEIEKTSLGAESVVEWSYAPNTMHVLPILKDHGYFILALEKDDRSELLSKILESGTVTLPLCVVVGNEVTGLYRETMDIAHQICHLPMRGMKTSLNVAVAFGIAMYQIAERVLD